MGNFVDERDQKPILVQGSIYGDLVQSIGQSAVITMPCHAMVHDFQMHPMGFDELKTGLHGTVWQVFLKGGVHWNKDTF